MTSIDKTQTFVAVVLLESDIDFFLKTRFFLNRKYNVINIKNDSGLVSSVDLID